VKLPGRYNPDSFFLNEMGGQRVGPQIKAAGGSLCWEKVESKKFSFSRRISGKREATLTLYK